MLDASDQLRTFALQETVLEGSTFRQRMCALADLVERETTNFVREWLESVRPCDSCGTWCLTHKVFVEGVGLAESQLCPACVSGAGPPRMS